MSYTLVVADEDSEGEQFRQPLLDELQALLASKLGMHNYNLSVGPVTVVLEIEFAQSRRAVAIVRKFCIDKDLTFVDPQTGEGEADDE
jgi:hypothetical protein